MAPVYNAEVSVKRKSMNIGAGSLNAYITSHFTKKYSTAADTLSTDAAAKFRLKSHDIKSPETNPQTIKATVL